MLQLFPKIQTAFESKKILFTSNNLPAIAFVDVYMGQPINPEEFEFTLPAVFIDYNIDWALNMLTVEAHVISEFSEDSGSIFTKKDEGINYLRTLAICKTIMTGLQTKFITRLKPIAERPATTEYYHYHILSFTANIQDYANLDLVTPSLVDSNDIELKFDKHTLKQKKPAMEIPNIDTY